MDSLQGWLAYLERIHPQVMELGLDRVRAVWQRLGHERPAPRVVTVAGTNGKGSTVVALDAVLRAAGLRTGATLSPHLLHFSERMLVNGVPAADDVIIAAFERVETARGDISLTYFEFAIVAALDLISLARVDVALLEVGLGGRLDAVNIIDADIAVISSVALDHEAWLGSDRETIGAEKAGVLRAEKPLICGESEPPASVLDRARTLSAPVWRWQHEFGIDTADDGVVAAYGHTPAGTWRRQGLQLPDLHQPALASALQAAALLDALPAVTAINQAWAGLTLPGRMQRLVYRGVELTLDVAHNPHAVAALVARLPADQRQHVVFGCFQDKQAAAMVEALRQRPCRFYLVPTPPPRGQSSAALASLLVAATGGALAPAAFTTVAEALDHAVEEARENGGEVLVCGSFTVVESALQHVRAGP